MPSKGAANESRCWCFKNSINLSLSFPNNNKKALRCIPTAKGFHNMDRSSRIPSRMTLLPLNPLIGRIKGDHATVIKLLSKEHLRSRKALILLGFSALLPHSLGIKPIVPQMFRKVNAGQKIRRLKNPVFMRVSEPPKSA